MGAERNVILLLLRDEQWIEKVARRIGVEDFRDGVYRELFAELLHLHGEGRPREGVEWLHGLSEVAVERVQELLADPEGMSLADPGRFFEENVRDILSRDQRARLSRGSREIERAPVDLQVSLLQNARDLRVEIERAGGVVRKDPSALAGGEDEPR